MCRPFVVTLRLTGLWMPCTSTVKCVVLHQLAAAQEVWARVTATLRPPEALAVLHGSGRTHYSSVASDKLHLYAIDFRFVYIRSNSNGKSVENKILPYNYYLWLYNIRKCGIMNVSIVRKDLFECVHYYDFLCNVFVQVPWLEADYMILFNQKGLFLFSISI